MSMFVSSAIRASMRRSLTASTRMQTRSFSSFQARKNVASETSLPLSEAVRNVAERAQSAVMAEANADGFRAGVVYTLLAGSVATAAILMLSPNGKREVHEQDLL